MSKRIVKNGVEYEYGETVAKEDMTISLQIPDRASKIDKDTVEKYKNSSQWKELDDLYIQLLKGNGNDKEILKKIVSYGEIAIVKHSLESMNFIKEGDTTSADFMLIPFFLEMEIDQAMDFLDRRYSDDEETSIIAHIELNEFIKDFRVETLIDIVGNARKEGADEVANGAMSELMRIGDIALPQLQLKIDGDIDSQFQMDLLIVSLTIIFEDENKSFELIQRAMSENEKVSNEANLEINKLINDIDIEPYVLRHPKLVEEINSFQKIVQEVFSRLSGDADEDIKYLSKQAEIYEDHEMGTEIVREISRAIFNLLPDNSIDEFSEIVTKDYQDLDKSLEEAEFQIYKKNYNEALSILEKIIEKDIFFDDDELSQYNYFNNIFEVALYSELFNPSKTLRKMSYDWGRIYFLLGNILLELERYSDAEEALNKSIKVNPLNTNSLFELSEIYKVRKEFDKYREIANKCLKYSYKNQDIARAYRNLGFYYIENEDYDLASALLQFSLMFDNESLQAMSELHYISQVTDEKINNLDFDKVEKLFEKNNIQYGPNDEVIAVARGLANAAEDDKKYETAILCYGIFYELTGNEEAKKKN